MNRYSVLLWTCILTVFVLPWLLATIIAWVYAEGYEVQSRSDEDTSPGLGYVTAIMQSSSVIVYIVFTLGGLICMGIVGRPDDLWTYCCLVIGVPVFFTIPVASGVLLLVSAFNNVGSTGRNIGITATIFCFSSTLPCCCVLICALACGTRGKGKRSRYPTPIAYLPVLGELKQREDKWEAVKRRREFTDDYPASSPPGPPSDHKAAKSANSVTEEDGSQKKFSLTAFLNPRRKSSSSPSQESKSVDKEPRRYSEPAIKNGLSKERSPQQAKTESNSKPNSKVDSIAKPPVKETHDSVLMANAATAPDKRSKGSESKRSMLSKLRRKSDTNV